MRELEITITANTAAAVQSFKQVDAAVAGVVASTDKHAASTTKATAATAQFTTQHKEAATAVDHFGQFVDRIIERMAIYASVRAVLGAVQGTVTFAHEMRNLSLETEIGTEQLQRIALVTENYGLSAAEVGRVVFQLSRRIAGNDESAVAALHLLGMTVDDVRSKKPDQLFIQMADAAARMIDTQQRSSVSADLFGARLGAAVIAAGGHIGELIADVDRMGGVISNDAVQANAKFEDSVSHLGSTMRAFGANILAPMLTQLEHYVDVSHLVTMPSQGGPIPGLQPPTGQLVGGPSINVDPSSLARMIAGPFLKDASKDLSAVQEKFLEILYDVGQLTTKNAEAMQITGAQVDLFKKKEDELIQTQVRLAQQDHDAKALTLELGGAYTILTGQVVEHRGALEVLGQVVVHVLGTKYMDILDKLNAKTMSLLEIQTRLRAQLMIEGSTALDALNNRGRSGLSPFERALQTRNQGLQDIANREAQTPGVTVNGVDVFSAMRAKVMADFDDAIAHLRDGASSAGTALTGIAPSVDAATAAFSRFTGATMAPFYTANGSVGVPGSNVGTPRGNNIGVPAIGGVGYGYPYSSTTGVFARASGGPVDPGMAYWVGERGPELFTPGSGGNIAPAGGVSIGDVHIHGDVDSASRGRQMADAVATEVMRRIKQANGKRPYAGS